MAIVSVLIFVTVLFHCNDASEFLSVHSLRKDQLEQAMYFGSAPLESMKAELSPTFNALPKNVHGNLEPSSVRYALHRYFIQKHGWFIKGLDPEGGNWDFSSHEMVKERATQYIQEMFDSKLHGRGLGLDDLASFAATVSDLVHGESLEDLEGVYQALELPLNEPVSYPDFDLAIRAFLSQTVVGFGQKVTGRTGMSGAGAMEEKARSSYPEYDDIVMWIRDLHLFNDFSRRSHRNPFASNGVDFDQASDLMKSIVHHFGSLLNLECQALKQDLVEMQIGSSGRVSLSSFFSNTKLPMHESVEYLRNLGTLEESEKHNPRLVIPNYVASKSRCLPFSGYYSVCCPDECQSTLRSIELEISAPSASPEMIVKVISRLPSASMEKPQNVSDPLFTRLRSIADLHGGNVPLHGRLFLQWLHHVYPLECPFPHITGTMNSVSQDDWIIMHSEIDDAMVTDDEKKRHMHVDTDAVEAHIVLPWSDVEELVDTHKAVDGFKLRGCLRWVMGLTLLVSFVVPMGRALSSLSSQSTRGTPEKHHHYV